MNAQAHGELVPVGGGDSIPLLRDRISIGRRESCDVSLRFSNVSGKHCELFFSEGYWYVRDLGSTNHTKVNNHRVLQKRLLRSGDVVAVANHRFKISYTMPTGHEVFVDANEEDIGISLLEKAGLVRPKGGKDAIFKAPPAPKPKSRPFVEPVLPSDDYFDDADDDDDD